MVLFNLTVADLRVELLLKELANAEIISFLEGFLGFRNRPNEDGYNSKRIDVFLGVIARFL